MFPNVLVVGRAFWAKLHNYPLNPHPSLNLPSLHLQKEEKKSSEEARRGCFWVTAISPPKFFLSQALQAH